MATVMTNDNHYTEIAEAIRTRNGSDTQYKPSEMADAIRELQPGISYTVYGFDGENGIGDYLFYKYKDLTYITTKYVIGISSFEGCSNLIFADIRYCTSIGANAFKDCSNLNTVVITVSENVIPYQFCNIDETAFLNTPIEDKTGYIYIKSKFIDEYIEAYPQYIFRAIEDYPEIAEVS